MAITQSALAHAMARDFLRAAPPEAHVSRLWVWSRHGYIDPERDYVHLTVLYFSVDDTAEKKLDKAIAGLHDVYPDVNIRVSTIEGAATEVPDLDGWIRPEAEEIDLVSR